MVVRIKEGGTGQVTAPGARIALGLSDQNIIDIVAGGGPPGPYQPIDADLTAIAALTTTGYGRGFLTLADAAGGRTYLGLGTMATQNTADFLPITGGTLTGNLNLDADMMIRGPAATSRFLSFTTGTSTRWILNADATPEGGLNAGSDFAIYRYDDVGGFLGQPLYIQRSTGDVFLERHLDVAGTLQVDQDLNVDNNLTVLGLTVLGDASVGDLDTGQILTVGGSHPAGPNSPSIELGRTNGIASTPVLDFHTSATAVDYDSRILATGGTGVTAGGNLSIDAAVVSLTQGKLQFPATQSPSTNVNTLDDYEEGLWTPELRFNGVATGITYSYREAAYIKVGRKVTASGRFILTSKGATVGGAAIWGLPFTVSNSPSATIHVFGIKYWSFMSIACIPAGYCIQNTAASTLINAQSSGGITALDNTFFSNATDFIFTITYFSDS